MYHYVSTADRISCDRFYDLHRYLCFADNSTLSPPHTRGYNKLGKTNYCNAYRDRFAAA